MATLEEITSRFKSAVSADGGLNNTITLDLKGEGFIHVDGTSVTNEDKPADVTLTVAKSDLEDMAQGRLDPTMAFMSGKLKIAGDMGVAMKLAPLLAKARG
jgi:putative sterol carrier protein